ncbi:MAG: hypothetical protein KAX37_05435 [Opitutaceae bacterium]|nr:hypothetical protein [Opitutaceae bacterium]
MKINLSIAAVAMAVFALLLGAGTPLVRAEADGGAFPRFIVPGQERAMGALNAMHRLHYPPVWLDYPDGDPDVPLCTLWDEWLTGPCLWADTQGLRVCKNKVTIAERLRRSFLNKIIDREGYVATHQHAGIGHVLGWPFPYWVNNEGADGIHFSNRGTLSAVLRKGVPVTHDMTGWELHGVEFERMDSEGSRLRVTAADASLTTPPLKIDSFQSPFVQLRWKAQDLAGARTFLEWEREGDRGFSETRRMIVPAAYVKEGEADCAMIPVYRHPEWSGRIIRLRLRLANPSPGGSLLLQAIFSQYDTRHNINNFDFIRGAIDYFLWTGDVDFLEGSLLRLRQALRFAQSEFKTIANRCVLTPWVGHDGQSGIERNPDGTARMIPGRGIGNNYWDLLPFGHKDVYASIRYYDTLRKFAILERALDQHPEWGLAGGGGRFDPEELERHAAEVKAEGNRLFWSEETGRFVAGSDVHGVRTDYGFTFLNTDAIHYGFATDAHAKEIMDWLEGRRIVEGDTSVGPDIYHFRFGPRSTTRRNTDYYFWRWNKADSIPFGGQVQDGGAVLGWSFMDLMSRIKVEGPDNAWARLEEILRWFEEVQAGGGYREYYRKKGTGLQGDGTAGGLGLDREFFESLLVPQVLLAGFAGFSPTAAGCRIDPRLPAAFPSLTIDRIHIKGLVLSLRIDRNEIVLSRLSGSNGFAFTIEASGYEQVAPVDWMQTDSVRIGRVSEGVRP